MKKLQLKKHKKQLKNKIFFLILITVEVLSLGTVCIHFIPHKIFELPQSSNFFVTKRIDSLKKYLESETILTKKAWNLQSHDFLDSFNGKDLLMVLLSQPGNKKRRDSLRKELKQLSFSKFKFFF